MEIKITGQDWQQHIMQISYDVIITIDKLYKK
jgi:hypothetical protein